MLRFASSLKKLMKILQIQDTSQVEKFLEENRASCDSKNILIQLKEGIFEGGFFRENMKIISCSSHETKLSELPLLKSTSMTGEDNFCLHSPLHPRLAKIYKELVEYAHRTVNMHQGKFLFSCNRKDSLFRVGTFYFSKFSSGYLKYLYVFFRVL